MSIAPRAPMTPARQTTPIHTFGQINIQEVMNPDYKYPTYNEQLLVLRQKVLLDNFWSLRSNPPNLVIAIEKIVRALEQDFLDFNRTIEFLHNQISSFQEQHLTSSREHNLLLEQFKRLSEKHEKLLLLYGAMHYQNYTLQEQINIERGRAEIPRNDMEEVESVTDEHIEQNNIYILQMQTRDRLRRHEAKDIFCLYEQNKHNALAIAIQKFLYQVTIDHPQPGIDVQTNGL
jgi:hypothetical protein